MAKRIKKVKDTEVQAEVERPQVKTRRFLLKQDLNGKKAGDSIEVGPVGEAFYKSKNII